MANTVAIDVKINALEASKTLKDLKTNLRDAVNELAGLESGTQEFNKLASAVDDAKDRIEKLNKDIEQVGGAGKFAALADFGSKIAAGFEVAQGAMALFGSESEEVKAALEKVQAAMALTQGLKDISEFGKSWTQLKSVVSDFGKSAMTALQGMKAGIAATGIGVLLIAVGALVAYWDDIKGFFDTLSAGAEKTKALNETLGDFKKGAQDAFKEINDVKVAFQQARDGVISKEQALKKYNETLGPVLGNAKSLNEAEEIMIKKADAYIKAQGLKAQANALFNKAAEEQAKALTASVEDQTNFLDKSLAAYFKYNQFNAAGADAFLKEQQEKGVKNAKENADKRKNLFEEQAQKLLKDADKLMKDNDIKEKQSNANTKVNYEKKVDLTAELNAKIKALQNDAITDARAADKAKEELDYQATVKEYETKYKGYKNLTVLLEELRLSHLNKIAEIDNKYNIEEQKKEDEKRKKKEEAERLERERIEKHNQEMLEGVKKDQADQLSEYDTRIKTMQRFQQNSDALELEAAQFKLDTIKNNEKSTYEERLAAQEEFDAKVAEIDKRDRERKEAAVQATLNVTKQGLQATADLVSAFAGKSKEAQKKAFEFQKGVNIATAVIDTFQSAVAAYKGSIGTPIVGPVLAPIAAAAAVAAGIANIRRIEQTKFDSKDTPSAGGGGGGGGSFAPNLSAPVGNTSTNLASIGFGNQEQPEPVKVFVTETDISSSQKNVQKIEQKASIE
jgi:hypothetical protein